LFRFRLSSSEVLSTEECSKLKIAAARLEHLQEPQNYEGKTQEMSSVTRLVSPRRGDILEGELGPYIPSSPVEDLSTKEVADGTRTENTSNRGTEEAARATGEVHFGNVESADGPMNPFPVLGVAAESTDELMTPPPTTIQLERNRSDLSPDLTDGKRTPTGAESMKTAELKEFYPLADCQLDTAEDYLHPATGSISQDTGSSGTPPMRNLPDQNTGSRDIQETGSLESPTADKLEAAIVASSTVRAPVHAAIYPNSGSISPFIITGNKSGEQLPMLNLDAMAESGRLEQGDHETAITTDVAGAELMTRTGHEYSQIPRTHAETETENEELEETSRKYGSTVAPNETAEPEKDYGDEDLETDLRESRAFDDVIVEQEVSEQNGVATDAHLSDVRLDQPTSSQKECYEETQPTEPSPQEVLVEATGPRPKEHATGKETPDSTYVHD